MHLQYFIWKHPETDKWHISQEVWKGNSWGSYYRPIAGPFDTRDHASQWLNAVTEAHEKYERERNK